MAVSPDGTSGLTGSGDNTARLWNLKTGQAIGLPMQNGGEVLSVSFSSGLLGSFDELIVLHSSGSNASGFNAALLDVQLHLVGSVTAANPVPEPQTYMLMLGGLAAMGEVVRRRKAQTRSAAAH